MLNLIGQNSIARLSRPALRIISPFNDSFEQVRSATARASTITVTSTTLHAYQLAISSKTLLQVFVNSGRYLKLDFRGLASMLVARPYGSPLEIAQTRFTKSPQPIT